MYVIRTHYSVSPIYEETHEEFVEELQNAVDKYGKNVEILKITGVGDDNSPDYYFGVMKGNILDSLSLWYNEYDSPDKVEEGDIYSVHKIRYCLDPVIEDERF